MSTTITTTCELDEPLYLVKRIMEKESLEEYRTKYRSFRLGYAEGAKGEMIDIVKQSFKRKVEDALNLPYSKYAEIIGDTENPEMDIDMPWQKAKTDDTTYELAKDMPIPQDIDQNSKFEARFERTKLMRSDVLVENGAVKNLAARALDIIPAKCHRSPLYIVTDSVTDPLVAQDVYDGLLSCGLNVKKFVITSETDESGETSTEETKTLQTFSKLADQVLQSGVDKRSCIISVGGGVVNNICGYLAGSIYRGISLIHFSTTFMGQVDAAIDFKQAVNHCCGKNLLGCYYPATKIVLDPSVLLTQSTRHRLNGLAESLKHAMVHSTDLLDFIVNSGSVADAEYLDGVVRRTIAIKVPTLTHYEASDFNEMAPQYGHAPAHAVEFLSWHGGCPEHGPILHGEAVAMGMAVSAEVAYLMGICSKQVVEDHYRVIEAVNLPSCVPAEMDLDKIIAKLAYDKHTLSGKPTMGFTSSLGDMYEINGTYGQEIDPELLRRAFKINMARGQSITKSLN
eukprot:CAMPEP_0197285586 /NCGR_PEP_ID=MMETSP0890-20130614/918_1 /TAXON_ID=44058 ORGANISM="Aureoumbra lagunensis, Strain CCMP1510" /NCGR_SAMPLE_ID=MMETSP0890 /ASSEMBLY_ACC=CAM_ASM_000533 /LENGTH=510 /DNA_ID=CAMNT_0042753245 /DNA_START=67 /DNA_END=1600 /DNA_ORIENTATION=+